VPDLGHTGVVALLPVFPDRRMEAELQVDSAGQVLLPQGVEQMEQRMEVAPCAQNDKINVLHEPYFGTHILGNHLPFQTSEIPKKNTKPLISIRGLAFDKLLQSSEK